MQEVFNKNLKAHLTIDNKKIVRSIRHSQEYWLSDQENPLPVATQYFRTMAKHFKIDSDQLRKMSEKVSYLNPAKQGLEYRLSDERQAFDSTTYGFYQTYLNIPVWQAGLKVTMKSAPFRIISSVNTSQENIEAKLPSKAAIERYKKIFKQAHNIVQAHRYADGESKISIPTEHAGLIRKLLGKSGSKKDAEEARKDHARLIRGRFFVYKYDKNNRLPGGKVKANVVGEVDSKHELELPLPPVDKRIKHGQYYMVAEISFIYATKKHGEINWRMLTELETGSVLYLRSLTSGVNGYAFLLDPISATGDATKTCDQPNSVLNPLRDDVTLNNLDAPVSGTQSLIGTYAKLADTDAPTIASPTEPTGTDFYYNVRSNDFAAVSAYFHVNRFFEIIESLGFLISTYFANTTFPIDVDHRGENGVSNAHCYGDGANGITKLTYGLMDNTGGDPLGRACDPRVHWHELGGHGVLYDFVGGPNYGFSHSSGDAVSGIFYDPDSKAPGDLRFEYVPWHATLRRRFDRDISAGWAWGGSEDDAGYGSEEILATSLFRIYQAIGGDSTNYNRKKFASRMMLYLIFRANQNLTAAADAEYARDFAQELMTVDLLNWTSEGIFGGAYNKVIRWSFEKQGEYQSPLLVRGDGTYGTNTSEGTPPDVDVYIDDGRQGEYDYMSTTWNTTTIWNRNSPDGIDSHDPPILDQPNYAYVKIKNRGTQQATNIVVKGFHSKPMAGISWPNDLQAFTTAEITVTTLNGNNSEEKIVGPFEWTPIINAYGHDCMMMILSNAEDPSNVDNFTASETIAAWRLVPNDNNVGQRNVQPVPGGGGGEALAGALQNVGFWVGNPNVKAAVIKLDVKIPNFLTKKGWKLDFKGLSKKSFRLKSGEQREVFPKLVLGKDFVREDIERINDRDIKISAYADGILIGGMTYRLEPQIRKAPDYRKSKCKKEAQDLLNCLEIRDQKVKKAKVKNIIVDIEMEDDDCGCC